MSKLINLRSNDDSETGALAWRINYEQSEVTKSLKTVHVGNHWTRLGFAWVSQWMRNHIFYLKLFDMLLFNFCPEELLDSSQRIFFIRQRARQREKNSFLHFPRPGSPRHFSRAKWSKSLARRLINFWYLSILSDLGEIPPSPPPISSLSSCSTSNVDPEVGKTFSAHLSVFAFFMEKWISCLFMNDSRLLRVICWHNERSFKPIKNGKTAKRLWGGRRALALEIESKARRRLQVHCVSDENFFFLRVSDF